MTISQSASFNEAGLTGRRDFLDTGSGNARIRVYDGTRPLSGEPPTSNTMLVEITLDKPCGTVASNSLTLVASSLPTIAASGTPSWARIVNGNGDFAFDCDAQGGPGAVGEVILTDAVLYAGGKVALISAVLG